MRHFPLTKTDYGREEGRKGGKDQAAKDEGREREGERGIVAGAHGLLGRSNPAVRLCRCGEGGEDSGERALPPPCHGAPDLRGRLRAGVLCGGRASAVELTLELAICDTDGWRPFYMLEFTFIPPSSHSKYVPCILH